MCQIHQETLAQYASEFKQDKYRSNTMRSMLHFLKFLGLVGAFLGLQYGLLQLELGGLLYGLLALTVAFFHGLTYISLWLVGHDCGHGSFSTNKGLNRVVGSISTAFMLMNYENFRRSHNRHHSYIGNIEKDEAFGPKPKRKNLVVQRLIRSTVLLPFLAYVMAILLPGLTKTPGYVNYFWPDQTKDSIKAFVPVVANIALVVGLAYWMPLSYALFAGIAPILVAWSFFLITTFLNHTGADTEWYPDEIWSYEQGVFNTVNLSYGPIIDFFLVGLGKDHFAHHVNPRIPHYKLPEATDYIGTSHPNNRMVQGNFFKFVYYYYSYSIKRILKGYFTNHKRPFKYDQEIVEQQPAPLSTTSVGG